MSAAGTAGVAPRAAAPRVRKSLRKPTDWRYCDCGAAYCKGKVPERTFYRHQQTVEAERTEGRGQGSQRFMPGGW